MFHDTEHCPCVLPGLFLSSGEKAPHVYVPPPSISPVPLLGSLPRSSAVLTQFAHEACNIPHHPLPPSPPLSWILWSFRTGTWVGSPSVPQEGFPWKCLQGCPLILGFWAVEKINILFFLSKMRNSKNDSLDLPAFFQLLWLRES